MNDPEEWQKSEARRRAGPVAGTTTPGRKERDREHNRHLAHEEVERIEEEMREEVAATPAISDS